MNFIKTAVSVGLVAFLSTACTGVVQLERIQHYDTMTVNGKDYDIHTAHKVDTEFNSSTKVRVLVPKGVKPTIDNTIATCSADKSDPECKQTFAQAAKSHNQQVEDEANDASH